MKKTIGRTDKVDFPALQLIEIDIKVDTGAYTSAIHCREIEEITVNGEFLIKFTLLDPSHPNYNGKEFAVKNYTRIVVKSSFGASEERFAINTEVTIFDKIFPIQLTLSERSDMKYPILLGRKFLTKKFVVDASRTNLSFKSKEKLT